jgi:exodeoxyribonuclease VII large subunit
MLQRLQTLLEHQTKVIDLTSRGALMLEPQRQLDVAAQRLDDLEQRWGQAAKESLLRRVEQLHTWEQTLTQYHPVKILADAGHQIEMAQLRLHQNLEQRLKSHMERMQRMKDKLRLLGPQSVLSRGYSYTTRKDGSVVHSINQLQKGEVMMTQLADGLVTSRVE